MLLKSVLSVLRLRNKSMTGPRWRPHFLVLNKPMRRLLFITSMIIGKMSMIIGLQREGERKWKVRRSELIIFLSTHVGSPL